LEPYDFSGNAEAWILKVDQQLSWEKSHAHNRRDGGLGMAICKSMKLDEKVQFYKTGQSRSRAGGRTGNAFYLKYTVLVMSALFLLVDVSAANNLERTAKISNVQPRRDINGDIIDAHDGCLEFFNGTYFLYGTRYGRTDGFGKSNRYVCYSSPDLETWIPRGEILKDAPPRVYYRPYVKFNKSTRKYVLWCNADNHYTVSVSDTPAGPFIVQNSNVRVKNGDTQGDFGLFLDDDGTGYITYSFSPASVDWSAKTEPIKHHQICVEKLTPDYLGSTMESTEPIAGNVESPAMFKRNGVYYLLFDNTCCFGVDGSGARVYTASGPMGPFVYRGNINIKAASARNLSSPFTEPGTGRPDCIIKAQQTDVATLPTSNGLIYIWMGDRWGSRPDGIKGHDFQYWSHPLEFYPDGMIKQLNWDETFAVGIVGPG
jgi:hypothetical protein